MRIITRTLALLVCASVIGCAEPLRLSLTTTEAAADLTQLPHSEDVPTNRGSLAYEVESGMAHSPALAPNGHTVAMTLSNVEVVESGAKGRTAHWFDQSIAITDLEGTGFDVLAPGTDPAWSPDGSRLAFARVDAGHTHLFVANADGTDAHRITEGPSDDRHPSFSPDGAFITFCSVTTEGDRTKANLFAVRPNGDDLIQLTEGDQFTCRPEWGRDGFVYFRSDAGGAVHIWRLRPASELMTR